MRIKTTEKTIVTAAGSSARRNRATDKAPSRSGQRRHLQGQHLQDQHYRQLAEFRYHLRAFLRFSEESAHREGLEAQKHQLLLAVRGLPGQERPTILTLAERLQIRHHSTVELIDRLERRGFVRRTRAEADRREVLIELTRAGERILQKLSTDHARELRSSGPELVKALRALLKSRGSRRSSAL